MKKILGWILAFCGVISLPNFLYMLAIAHHGYQVIGMLIGQGLIYYLAYLCLRKKHETANESDSVQSQSKVAFEENLQTSNNIKNDKDINAFVRTALPKEKETNMTTLNENVAPYYNLSVTSSIVNENPVQTEYVAKDAIQDNNCPNTNFFPNLKHESISWSEIYSLIFKYQKKELLSKCNPSQFMNPYNHDKIAIANDCILKIEAASSLLELKPIRLIVSQLGVHVDSSQIYKYLLQICDPTNFTGKTEEFQLANNLYQRIINSGMDYEVLEEILDDAHTSKLGIKEVANPIVKKPVSKKLIWSLTSIGLWEVFQITLWAVKGSLYNSTLYFYPFLTTNIAKYDYTEFLAYGIALPTVFASIIFIHNKLYRK